MTRTRLAALAVFAFALPVFAADGPKLVPENIARGKAVTASSTQRDGLDPAKAADGDPDTRWCADGPRLGSWWQVDLGRPEDLTGGRIVWESGADGYRYKLEGSADGSAWATLADHTATAPKGQTHDLKFGGTARYMRLTVTGLPEGQWPSVYEVEVLGSKLVPLPAPVAPNKVASLAGVKAPPGFDLTLFAGPPDVSYPTCLAAGPDGTLYVGVDLNGSLGRGKQKGKVVRCRDTDGDGKADQFVTFCELDSPRGLWWDNKKTLVVLHPPTVTAYHDDDGDGKADRSNDLVTGLGFDLKTRGADHTTNGFRVGIDGFLYIAVGDYGAVKAVGTDGRSIQLRGGGVVRVRTDGTGLEVVSRGQRNIYDVAVSPTLDLFTRDNTNDGDGWDVRLSHVVPTAHYGYPTLYKHFADDHIQPLADYGGGSPCGSLFLDEPGYPPGTGTALYTAEWGRGGVFRHPLTPNGASWKAGQEAFLTIPRPTDLDADGVGHLYVSSWKDGGFDYSGPAVGYVVRLTPTGHKPTTFPDLAKATDEELVKFLLSPSGVLRFYASREILGRGSNGRFFGRLVRLAGNDNPLSTRVAAVFTLQQLSGPQAAVELEELTKDAAVREYALKALADAAVAADNTRFALQRATTDANPRVRVQAAIGLGRLGATGSAASLVQLTADPDPAVAHVAVNALVQLKAADACLNALNGTPASGVAAGVLRVLRQLHGPAVVDALIARLATAKDEPLRHGILTALARLYQKEADWTGTWWGTRPDTTGPYYKPVTWSESPKIATVFRKTLADADGAEQQWLLSELARHRVELPEATAAALTRANADPKFRPTAVMLLARGTPPAAAIPLFADVAADTAADPATRAVAVRALLKYPANDDARMAAVTALTAGDRLPAAIEPLWVEYARDGKHTGSVAEFASLAKNGTPGQRELAYGVLATVADRPLGAKSARATADTAVRAGLADPAAAPVVLKAVARLNLAAYAPQIRPLLASTDATVAAAAKAALKAMKLDVTAAAGTSPTIGKLKFDQVQMAAVAAKGKADLGARLFERVGCVNCHTVSTTEPLKGPLLAGITTRYSRPELVESIVRPSAKIAQGFETVNFAMSDGKTVTGFVVRESGTEVEVRDATGATVVLKKDEVDERKPGKLSVMPEQLVDHLTPEELASIRADLESLKGK